MTTDIEGAAKKQAPITPRSYQLEAATCLDHAVWDEGRPALAVLPVAAGKTVILILTAARAVDRGYDVIVVSRSGVIAEQSLKTLARMRPDISSGLYTGRRKAKDADILFATAKTLAGHLDIVRAADLLLIDEADQTFIRDSTKEYAAILEAARRYAGCTGTPFCLHKGRTVPIFANAVQDHRFKPPSSNGEGSSNGGGYNER
jgi:superfamily II DNA or RNA helicase